MTLQFRGLPIWATGYTVTGARPELEPDPDPNLDPPDFSMNLAQFEPIPKFSPGLDPCPRPGPQPIFPPGPQPAVSNDETVV